MANLLDYILDLFRNEEQAAAFVNNPDQALRSAGLGNVSPAQVQAVAATAAPSMALGDGDPIVGLQRAVAEQHSFASPFSPQTSFAPQTSTEFASRNNTDLLSGNEVASPDQAAGANAQNGAFNLGFGDITLGDKTTNTATDGGVVVGGDNSGDIESTNVEGDGNVVGNEDTNANTGNIGGNANIGEDNELDDSGDIKAGGDVIKDNEGPVVNDVDLGGGSGGGAAGGDGGGGLIGVGNDGGGAAGGAGGGGGTLIIEDNDDNSVGGNKTEVGGDVSGSGGIDNSVDNSGQDNSVDNSVEDNDTNVITEIQTNNLDESTSVDAGLF